MRTVARLFCWLLVLLVLYTAAMLAAYAFPDEWIAPRVTAAGDYLREEGNMPGDYAMYFMHSGIGITDNVTDQVIYEGLLRGDRSVVAAAMRTDYARYWHGYAAILRPLSIFLSIIHIRFLNMMLFALLLMLCYHHLRLRFSARLAFAFMAGLMMSFIIIAPFCQQYVPVYLLGLAGCYALLRFWERLRDQLPLLFLTIGSLVCFFDFLTFPVLALGYPLLIALLLSIRDGKSAKRLWAQLFWLSCVWMAGYGLTWAGKALAGGLLTGQDVLGDIIEQAQFRTAGGFEGKPEIEITALSAIKINLETFFTGFNTAFALALLGALGVWALLRLDKSNLRRALPVAAVALYPFIWYAVLQNHVRVHFWMTHKQLAVTIFALCAALLTATRGGLEDK